MNWIQENHIIHFEGKGNFQSEEATKEAKEIFITQFPASEKKRIVIHFHGGLVNHKRALKFADEIGPQLQDDINGYPLFVVWRSGALQVLPDTIKDLANNKSLLEKLIEWVMKILTQSMEQTADSDDTEGLESLSKRPIDENSRDRILEDEITPELADLIDFDDELIAILEEIDTNSGYMALQAADGEEGSIGIDKEVVATQDVHYVSESFIRELVSEDGENLQGIEAGVMSFKAARIIVRIAKRVLKRHRNPLSWNGLIETVTEETLREAFLDYLGRGLWSTMKSNALSSYDKGKAGDELASYLADILKTNPDISLHIIAHSAGSFHAAGLIENLSNQIPRTERELLVETIHFLAPACDFTLFENKILQQQSRINHFKMFTMAEEYEDSEKMVPVIYESSLLCLISGLLEEKAGWPVLGMERFLKKGTDDNIKAFNEFLQGKKRSLVLTPTKPSGKDGERSTADNHGGFGRDAATLDSIKHLIQKT